MPEHSKSSQKISQRRKPKPLERSPTHSEMQYWAELQRGSTLTRRVLLDMECHKKGEKPYPVSIYLDGECACSELQNDGIEQNRQVHTCVLLSCLTFKLSENSSLCNEKWGKPTMRYSLLYSLSKMLQRERERAIYSV